MLAAQDHKHRPGLAIQERLDQLGLTQGELGQKIDRSQSWVSNNLIRDTERAIKYMSIKDPERLERLLGTLQWSLHTFSASTGVYLMSAPPGEPQQTGVRHIPVYALDPADALERGRSIDTVIVSETSEGEMAFVIGDDTMAPTVVKGATVVVVPQSEPALFEIVVGFSPEYGGLCRRLVRREGDLLTLVGDNPNSDTLRVSDFVIDGVVRSIITPNPGPKRPGR